VDLEEAGVIGLKAAHSRGVDVEVIVNRISARQYKSGSHYSAATYLTTMPALDTGRSAQLHPRSSACRARVDPLSDVPAPEKCRLLV
jgi:hypothetical protein